MTSVPDSSSNGLRQKQKADARGRAAELAAILLLTVKGYTVIARRVRHRAGEIDLIALRGRTIAFIEVKARASHEAARLSLGAGQREGIVRAALAWVAARPWAQKRVLRFDLVTVAPGSLPRHMTDAWRPQNDPALVPAQSRHGGRS